MYGSSMSRLAFIPRISTCDHLFPLGPGPGGILMDDDPFLHSHGAKKPDTEQINKSGQIEGVGMPMASRWRMYVQKRLAARILVLPWSCASERNGTKNVLILRIALIDEQIPPTCSRGLPSVTSYSDPRSPLLCSILDHRMRDSKILTIVVR